MNVVRDCPDLDGAVGDYNKSKTQLLDLADAYICNMRAGKAPKRKEVRAAPRRRYLLAAVHVAQSVLCFPACDWLFTMPGPHIACEATATAPVHPRWRGW